MNTTDDPSVQDAFELGAPMADADALPQPGPLLSDLFNMSSDANKLATGAGAQDDLPSPGGDTPADVITANAPYTPKRVQSSAPAGNVFQMPDEVMRRGRALPEDSLVQSDPIPSSMTQEQVVADLHARVSSTQGANLAENYLAGIANDFQNSLEQVPGLSDAHKELAMALFHHHVIMSVVANPSHGSDLEALSQIKLMASQRSAAGFAADWSRLVSSASGNNRDALVVVHDLAANLYRSHDSKLVSTLERLASRHEVTGAHLSTDFGIATGLGAVVGGLTNAGQKFFSEMRRRIDKGLHKSSSVSTEYGDRTPSLETVDVDVNAWRSSKAAALALEVQRLVGEISTKAGDIEWENGRGKEAASDLKLAVEGLGEMAEEGALEHVQSTSVKQVLGDAAKSMEESEKRMRTVQLRDLVAGLSAAITDLAGRVLDSFRSIAQSVTGSPDASPVTPPAQGDAQAKSLEPEKQPQHHARTMPRP